MGKYNQGILGSFSGKVGTVVGSFWKQRWVMRSRPTHVTNPNTQSQQTVREGFALLSRVMSRVRSAVEIGFKSMADSYAITPVNAAIKENFDVALTGSAPNVAIDYSRLILSKGDLQNVQNGAATVSGSAAMVSWVNNAGITPDTLDDDYLCIAIYCEHYNQAVVTAGASTRVDQAATVSFPSLWSGQTGKVYIFTYNNDGRVSDSVLAGTVTF